MRILIADDDAIARKILKAEIDKAGHECFVARDGVEAWALYQQESIEVVISDWMMPGIDGIELCQRVRGLARSAYTYFILLTLSAGKSNLVRGIEAGADDYMTKPFDPEELQAGMTRAAGAVEAEVPQAHGMENILIEELELGVRSYNCLKRAGVQTIGDLVQKSESELSAIPNFGRKSIEEVKETLRVRGLGLRDD